MGLPEHLWFVRRIRIDAVEPLLADRELEVVTCAGSPRSRPAPLVGDGRSGWADRGLDPSRPCAAAVLIEGFEIYGETTRGGGCRRIQLPEPPPDARRAVAAAAFAPTSTGT